MCVYKYRDLGTGKTTLARGLIKAAAGGEEVQVTSPSYLLDNRWVLVGKVVRFCVGVCVGAC